MDQIQAEIEAIRSQIKVLHTERETLTAKLILPENQSPEAIAEAYRRQAREAAEVSTEIEGIDQAIAALEAQLQQKERELQPLPAQQPLTLQDQVEQARQRAYDHADRINELAAELAEELRALKAITHDISPSYWQLYGRPFITGFKDTSVPYLRVDGEVLMIASFLI